MIIGITMQQPTSDGPHPALSAAVSQDGGGGLVGVSKDYGPGAHFDASQLPPHHVVIPTDPHHHLHHQQQQQHYSGGGGAGVGVGLPPPPPQQVYVNTPGSSNNNNNSHGQQPQDPIVGLVHPGGTMDMSGLESQFQSLGLRQEEGTTTSTDPSSGPHGDVDDDDEIEHDGADEDDDDEDGEEDPVKLFVGQVREDSSASAGKRY
jgi:hypothetical protein